MNNTATKRDLLDEAEASEYLGDILPRTLRQWRYRGRGPAYVKVGPKHVRYRRADLDNYIATHRVTPPERPARS